MLRVPWALWQLALVWQDWDIWHLMVLETAYVPRIICAGVVLSRNPSPT